MDKNELQTIRNRGDLTQGLHVMREIEIKDVTNKLTECFSKSDSNSKANILYSMLQLHPCNLKPFIIRSLHLRSEQVMFVYTNSGGEIKGIVSLCQPGKMFFTKHIGLIAIFEGEQTERIQIAVEILKCLEQLVSSLFLAKKLRMILQDCSTASRNSVPDINILCNWDELKQILTRCGYRNEAKLVDEFGPGTNASYYCKII